MPKITMNSTVYDVLQNEKAVKLAESYMPGITRHPAVLFLKAKTLAQVLHMFPVQIPQEKIDQILHTVNEDF